MPTSGWSAGTSLGGMSCPKRIVGGCSRSHGSDAATPASHSVSSASTSVPQPSASALPGMYMSSQVSEQDAGYVTSHSPPLTITGTIVPGDR